MQEQKVLQVIRKWQTLLSTIAEFQIVGTDISGFTLEPPGPDTTEEGENKRIPEGEFSLKWYNADNPSLAKYNPLPLIFNDTVTESRLILFHNGNYPKNTEGCLLVGQSRDVDMVDNSVKMLQALQAYLHGVGIENIRVQISSNYLPPSA